jgi:hypothetical protein
VNHILRVWQEAERVCERDGVHTVNWELVCQLLFGVTRHAKWDDTLHRIWDRNVVPRCAECHGGSGPHFNKTISTEQLLLPLWHA